MVSYYVHPAFFKIIPELHPTWRDTITLESIEKILEGGSGIVDHKSPTTGLDTRGKV